MVRMYLLYIALVFTLSYLAFRAMGGVMPF
jgi:hypothetical protein